MQPPDPFTVTLHEVMGVFMHRSMRGFLAYAKESGLSMSQIGAMFFLHKGSSGVSDLGDELGVTSAAASQMLERLVQQELILRSEDPHDRRVKQIVLTGKGRDILQEGFHARQGWLDAVARTLSTAEKEQIIAALDILTDKANQLDQLSEPQR